LAVARTLKDVTADALLDLAADRILQRYRARCERPPFADPAKEEIESSVDAERRRGGNKDGRKIAHGRCPAEYSLVAKASNAFKTTRQWQFQ
jgi:hypothetical protein